MPALSYAVKSSEQGLGGLRIVRARVIGASAADTVDFAADLAKVTGAAVVADTKNAPGAFPVPAFATTVVTIGAGYNKDDLDLVVVGPSQAA